MGKNNRTVLLNRIAHVKKRAKQRFNLDLQTRDILNIANMIRSGESQYIDAESNKRSLHLIEYEGKEMIVVYHKDNKIPVTILPKEDNHYDDIKKQCPSRI